MKYILPILLVMFLAVPAFATDRFVVQQRVVQFDPNTFLGVQGYYAHGQQLRAQKLEEEAELVKAVKEQNEILKQMVQALMKGKVEGGTPPTPVVPTPEEPTVPALETAVLKIFTEKCAKCHGDTKADGGLTLIKDGKIVKDEEDKFEVSKRLIVHHRVNGVNLSEGETRMPKGNPLSDEEVETLRLWAVDKSVEVLNKRR